MIYLAIPRPSGMLKSTAILVLMAGHCFAKEIHHQPAKPNIIFILADDHGQQAIGCYGSKLIKTPGIDRLAKEGMRFTHCFNVNSLCAPSRAALITGKYNAQNGVLRIGDRLDEKQATFPMLLQKAGYQTAIIGKWHLESEPQGFDYYKVLPGQGKYFDCPMKEKGEPWISGNIGGVVEKGFISDVITDQSIEWLNKNKGEKPLFLMIHHKAPHTPHEYPQRYASLFKDHDLPLPDTFEDDFVGKNSGLASGKAGFSRLDHIYPDHFMEKIPTTMPPDQYKYWSYQTFFKGYLRLVSSLDENISRLLDYLDQSGLAQNTLVVYTSDNGFFVGEHGLFNKMWMYEESMKLPLIIRYPGHVKAGSVNNNLVSILDFAPTFAELANAEIPAELQGLSIVPFLKGKKTKRWRDGIYYHYYDQFEVPEQEGIRTEAYKLIKFDPGKDHSFGELYDLKSDPNEMNNLYLDPSKQSIRNNLEKELIQIKNKFESKATATKY